MAFSFSDLPTFQCEKLFWKRFRQFGDGCLLDSNKAVYEKPDESKTMTLAGHAEFWWREQGHEVPDRNSGSWDRMYEKWHDWAFADFAEEVKHRQ